MVRPRQGIVSVTFLTCAMALGVTLAPGAQKSNVTQPLPPATSRIAILPADASVPKSNITASQLTRGQMEHFLLTAQIVAERKIPIGVTHTRRATLTDGNWIHDAHIQDVDVYKDSVRLKEGIERNFRDSYKFNIAAYRLDKLMNLNMIPVCVYREVDGKPAAVSWWVDNVQFDETGRREKNAEPPDLNEWVRQLNEVRVFDALIYNEDRNQGNLLIDKDWKVWMIDHTRAFRDDPSLHNKDTLRRCSQKTLDAMKALTKEQLEQALMPYVTGEDIQALLARRDLLEQFFAGEIQSKGPAAVLTDMTVKTPQVTIP